MQHTLVERGLEYTTISSGSITAVLGFLNHYAAALGVLCTFILLMITAVFKVLYYRAWKEQLDKGNKIPIET